MLVLLTRAAEVTSHRKSLFDTNKLFFIKKNQKILLFASYMILNVAGFLQNFFNQYAICVMWFFFQNTFASYRTWKNFDWTKRLPFYIEYFYCQLSLANVFSEFVLSSLLTDSNWSSFIHSAFFFFRWSIWIIEIAKRNRHFIITRTYTFKLYLTILCRKSSISAKKVSYSFSISKWINSNASISMWSNKILKES